MSDNGKRAGVIGVRGRLPMADEKQGILLHLPVPLKEALTKHVSGSRSAVIVALIANAVDRAMAGETILLEAKDVEHWYKRQCENGKSFSSSRGSP